MDRLAVAVRARLTDSAGVGVIAVSGGADSVALLRAVERPVVVAHVNHGWRGAASDADERFVRQFGERLGHPVRTLLAPKTATEADARRVRYEWFAELAAELKLNWVATAHTADDQAETVLHRMIRGSGLTGLRGIPDRRPLAPGVQLVRPMLTVTRSDVLAYLDSLAQPFCTDETNVDPAFTRNRIRHELLPLLRTFNPDVSAALGRLARQADELFDAVETEAEALLDHCERPPAGDERIFDAEILQGVSPVRLRELFRLVWRRAGWPTANMDAAAWDRVVRVAKGQDAAWDFPGGVRMTFAGRVVRLRLGP